MFCSSVSIFRGGGGLKSRGLGILLADSCFRLFLFMIYTPRETVDPSASPSPQSQGWKNSFSNTHPSPYTALIVTAACLIHLLIHVVLAFYISAIHPSFLEAYATFLGVQSAIVASTQYIPQIYTTWKLQHVGSLSIPMMCIQTPGSFVWAASLATREGVAWSSWITYIVTGLLQGTLLFMCIMFEARDRKSGQKLVSTSRYSAVGTTVGYESEDEGEEAQLLSESQRS